MKFMNNTLSTVSKMIAIAIGDRKATITIDNLFSNGDRDRDRDRNFCDRGHALYFGRFGAPLSSFNIFRSMDSVYPPGLYENAASWKCIKLDNIYYYRIHFFYSACTN